MAYQVLARKYRPLRFSDVVGQDHVTRTLLNALAQDRIAHGYIFSGHRGIGKTTIARILASALNCQNAIGSEARPTPEPCLVCNSCVEIRAGNSVDMLEIDAATNRGIDEIRELRDAARYRPARDRFKIILLDEAHQITDAAFNALLKTLEEPPGHIVFMMATTQPEDIPQTIRSRCQHFSFHAVRLDDIVGQLRKVSDEEKIDVDAPTLGLLAEAGDGSMRDALSIMDQAIASAPEIADGRPHIELQEVRELMGTVSNVVFEEILNGVHANNSAAVLSVIGRLLDAGNGPQAIARQFVRFLRNCLVAKITGLGVEDEATGVAAELLQISGEERRRAARAAAQFSEEELTRFLSIVLRTFDDLGYRQEQRLHFELGLLKLVHVQRLVPVEELLGQLGLGSSAAPPVKTAASSLNAETRSGPAAAATSKGATTSPSAAAVTLPLGGEALRSAAEPPIAPTGGGAISAGGGAMSAGIAVPLGAAVPLSSPQTMAGPPASGRSAAVNGRVSPVHETSVNAPSWLASTSVPVERSLPSMPASTTQPDSVQGLPGGTPVDAGALQAAVVAVLAGTKGQTSAAEQLEEGQWSISGDTLQIQTAVSKAMLPVVLNADGERLLKAALRENGAGHLQLKLLPRTAATSSGKPQPVRAAAAGSAAELAEKHPMVQEAKRLFSAEISNVIDLRGRE